MARYVAAIKNTTSDPVKINYRTTEKPLIASDIDAASAGQFDLAPNNYVQIEYDRLSLTHLVRLESEGSISVYRFTSQSVEPTEQCEQNGKYGQQQEAIPGKVVSFLLDMPVPRYVRGGCLIKSATVYMYLPINPSQSPEIRAVLTMLTPDGIDYFDEVAFNVNLRQFVIEGIRGRESGCTCNTIFNADEAGRLAYLNLRSIISKELKQ